MNWRYEVTESNEVKVYNDTQEECVIYQPTWPNGEPFTNAQAHSYGELTVTSYLDETSLLPGTGPDAPTRTRPTAMEIAEGKLLSAGLTVDDLKALLGL